MATLLEHDLQGRLFHGFGDCRQSPRKTPSSEEAVLPSKVNQRRELVRARVPACPGVYGMVDEQDHLIYVGKSKRLRGRLLDYFYAQPPPKAKRIIARTRRLVWEPAPHEFGALLRELELIRRFLPRFNVQGKPGRIRRCFVYLTNQEAPHFRVDKRPAAGANVAFGPLPAPQTCRLAVERLNYHFRLRDCPQRVRMYFADQPELFPTERTPKCLRFELGTCLGPCAGECRRSDYSNQVEAARRLLEGKDEHTLSNLERAMEDAATRQMYERAAALRDTRFALAWLCEQLDRLRQIVTEYSFVYPLAGYHHRHSWYVIQSGRMVGVINNPLGRGSSGACKVLEQAISNSRESGNKDALGGVDPQAPELETIQLIGAWFRQNPQELQRTTPLPEALEQCRSVRRAATA